LSLSFSSSLSLGHNVMCANDTVYLIVVTAHITDTLASTQTVLES
jgi:hypothetical protein